MEFSEEKQRNQTFRSLKKSGENQQTIKKPRQDEKPKNKALDFRNLQAKQKQDA